MISGVGVDLIELPRIAEAMEDPAFVERILSPSERKSPITAEWLAGRWAAKEAVAKAVGTHLGWHEVVIEDIDDGWRVRAPFAGTIHLTISIGEGLALATVMAVEESIEPAVE